MNACNGCAVVAIAMFNAWLATRIRNTHLALESCRASMVQAISLHSIEKASINWAYASR